ncbi:MAG TPA: CvpA family protein [Candidatus Binatia bacterium]
MNIVDLILLALLSLFALRGYFKGLFRETFSLLGLFVGFIVAARYEESVATLWIETWKSSFIVLRAATFVALFFLCYFSLNLIGWVLHRSASFLFLQGINRIGGIAVGLGKGAALMALAIFFLVSTPFVPRKAKESMGRSYLAPAFNQLAQGLVGLSKTAWLAPSESRAGDRSGMKHP